MGIEDSINHSIAWIDSIITDIPYPSMSTIDGVTSITGEKKIESSEMGKTYHEADSKWNEFKVLCSKKEYRKAYDLYYKDKGAFMVALKSTTAQYVFYTEVLNELDRKYDPTHALENMVSNLNLNILMTNTIIQLSEGNIVPPHFSELFISRIGEELSFDMAYYEMDDSYIRSLDFTKAGSVYFEPISSIMGENDDYTDCFRTLTTISQELAIQYLRMIWLDTICFNMHRHTENFGFLRDPNNGNIISMAPNYDNNIALISTY